MSFTRIIATEQRKTPLIIDLKDRAECYYQISLDRDYSNDLCGLYNYNAIYATRNCIRFNIFRNFTLNLIDFSPLRDIIILGINGYLFWGVKTPNLNGEHQSIFWCDPRYSSYDWGDDSVYNRLFELKAIVTVLGGFFNSPIAKIQFRFIFYYLFLALSGLCLFMFCLTGLLNFDLEEMSI